MMDYDKLYDELCEWYGKPIPNPDHCPIEFAHIVKLFKYYRKRQ